MDTAPRAKSTPVERLGATIVPATYDECRATVQAHGSPRMRGAFVHPFDDDRFIAGNGTVGLEILEDLPDVDAVVGALGGGGLLSGVASAIRAERPDVQIFAAEPETAAPLHTSIQNGRASRFDAWQPSFVDGAGGKSVLDSMWPLLKCCHRIDCRPLPTCRGDGAVAQRSGSLRKGGSLRRCASLTAGGRRIAAIVSGAIRFSKFVVAGRRK